jgi:SAM-dependent methyltransferase
MTVPLGRKVQEQVEIEERFWRSDPFERPDVDTLENFANKAPDAAIFLELVRPWISQLPVDASVIELGGGQGWASCLVKRLLPQSFVTLTDAVAEAVQGAWIWQRVFNCSLDRIVASPAQTIPAEADSVDFVFCFAAAHHFVDHEAALGEVARVLKSDGRCIWFYEPTAPSWSHHAAEARVNRKRPDVPEHVLIPAEIGRIAVRVGLTCKPEFCTSIAHRGKTATLYYILLGTFPFLQRVLPCTAHFVFTRAR